MKYFLLILIVPLLISCSSTQIYDDGTNGSLSINTDILSDDGTTAFVAFFYKNEAPSISKNLKEKENQSVTLKTENNNTSSNKNNKISDNNSVDKIKSKDDKPEIEIVSVNDKSKNKTSTVKDSISNKTNTDTKKTEQPNIKKEIPLFLYPVTDIVIKKEFSSSGENKNAGLDFSIENNTDIFAAAPGVVIFAGEKNSLGKSVFIYHDKGYISIYYNLSSISVAKGGSVSSSNIVIGKASSSFHFEIRHQTSSGIEVLNPKNILQKRRK